MNNDFNTKKLYEYIKAQNEIKNKSKIKIYNKILLKIQHKIFKLSAIDKYSFLFEIPSFILGEPLYKLNECSKYIYNNLISNGFNIRLFTKQELKNLGIKNTNSCIIYITWKHLNENENNNINNINNNINNNNTNNNMNNNNNINEKYIYINNKNKK